MTTHRGPTSCLQ